MLCGTESKKQKLNILYRFQHKDGIRPPFFSFSEIPNTSRTRVRVIAC